MPCIISNIKLTIKLAQGVAEWQDTVKTESTNETAGYASMCTCCPSPVLLLIPSCSVLYFSTSAIRGQVPGSCAGKAGGRAVLMETGMANDATGI
eukprot:scaffold490465_cov23-Prasinocladus_malaysianus.AAC.1